MKLKPNLSTRSEQTGREAAELFVLGGEHVGAAVARRLRAHGHDVALVDAVHEPSDIPVQQGNPADVRTLGEAGVSSASTVVVATPCDSRNLLVAQLARAHFDVSRVVVLASVPDRCELLTAAGHEPVCATTALSTEIVDKI